MIFKQLFKNLKFFANLIDKDSEHPDPEGHVIEGRVPTRIVLDRIRTGLGINPRENPIALSLVFKHLKSPDFRHPQTGLIRQDKIHSFAEALVKTDELSTFIKGKPPEALRDELLKWQIVSSPEKERSVVEHNNVALLESLSASEDTEAESLINSAIILVASKRLQGARSPDEVVEIIDLFQRHLPQIVDEMGVNRGLFFEILVGMTEVAREKLEVSFEAAVKEQLGIMMEERDLIHHLLHIVTWEGVNRAAYFREMADGFMAIGSVSSEEHLGKMAKIAGVADRTKLIEPPGVFNPDEDAPLNELVKSIRLTRHLPDAPTLVEKGRAYQISANGDRIEIERETVHQLVSALTDGLKFDNAPVPDFALIPVRNGKQLGFVYIDNAFDKTPIEIGRLARRIGYAGTIIDAALKRGKAKNDKMIGQLLQDWLKDYQAKLNSPGAMRGYLLTYRANILRKEKADHIRSVDVKQLINESLNRLLPSGINASINVDVSADASNIYYQPYHLQGMVDGLTMNAIWSHEAAKNRNYKISIVVRREENKLILIQTNDGEGTPGTGMSDRDNLDLGTSIIADALDVKLCDPSLGPQYSGTFYHGNPHIIARAFATAKTQAHDPGIQVILNDVEFAS